MCMAESGETHNVDEEAENTDDEEFVQSLQFMALPQAFGCIKDDFYADKASDMLVRVNRLQTRVDVQKKDTIGETRQGIDLAVPVREACIGTPFAHDCGCQTNSKTSAVKKHVDTVGE